MTRIPLCSLIALSALQHALAQSDGYTPGSSLTTAFPSTASITPIDTAEWVADQSSIAASRASVSSLLGPFYETVMFVPGLDYGDWVSAIASGGENDETTTWAGYWQDYYTDPAERLAVVNMTIGPTTYIETDGMEEATWTLDGGYRTTTMFGFEKKTRCSHTSIAPKISIPDAEWQAGLWNPLTLMSDHYFTYTAICSAEGQSSVRSGVSSMVWSWTLDQDTDPEMYKPGWHMVTVVGESPSPAAASATLTAAASAQTGSGSGTEGVQATSTQVAGATEVTAWVNAVVVVAAVAAIAM